MLKNKILFLIFPILLLVFSFNLVSYVYAEDDVETEVESTANVSDNSEESNDNEDNDESKVEQRKNYREEMRNQWLENKEQFKRDQEERKARVLEKKDEVESKRCEAILEKVTKRLENYNDTKEVHVDNYARLYEKLSGIAATLKDKGYDVAKLEADLVTFDIMVKEYASSYSAFIGKLEAAQEYTCGGSEGMFRQLLEESKDQLKLAIEKRQEIRAFYAHTLRKDIQDIRMQNVEKDDEIDSEEEVENE